MVRRYFQVLFNLFTFKFNFLRMFILSRNLSLGALDKHSSSFNDTERRNSFLCDIIHVMYNSGIMPHKDVAVGSGSLAMCPPMWDQASCLPATPAGHVSVIPCMAEFKDVYYNTTGT